MDLQTHYLVDLEYGIDEKNGFGRIPYLSVFNPGENDAQLTLLAFYADLPPDTFELVAPARSSLGSSATEWPVPLNSRFSLLIKSSEPVVIQATQGWNNTSNDYSVESVTTSPIIRRETAKSYMSLNALARECYIADGLIIDAPEDLWIKETEDTVILNPNKQKLNITLSIYFGERSFTRFDLPVDIPILKKQLTVAPERMEFFSLTDWLKSNWHYGARITGDRPFAAQWLRTVYWYDSAEVMSEWSVPCVQTVQ